MSPEKVMQVIPDDVFLKFDNAVEHNAVVSYIQRWLARGMGSDPDINHFQYETILYAIHLVDELKR